MNQSNDVNAELLSAESRGRRHVPLAVFAVIMIHIILFVILLVAAGCRAKTRARQASSSGEPAVKSAVVSEPTNAVPTTPAFQEAEPVIATEPAVEGARVSPVAPERAAQPTPPARARADTTPVPANGIYVVQPGDTVGKIAKEHRISIRDLRSENRLKNDLIRPGQKLRVSRSTQLVAI